MATPTILLSAPAIPCAAAFMAKTQEETLEAWPGPPA